MGRHEIGHSYSWTRAALDVRTACIWMARRHVAAAKEPVCAGENISRGFMTWQALALMELNCCPVVRRRTRRRPVAAKSDTACGGANAEPT